jgi:4a-hydroxytetrahydrobiopterin dehydratase
MTISNKHCIPCEAGVKPMGAEDIEKMMIEVPGWTVNKAGNKLSRRFAFKGFNKVMAFMNAIAWIAHQEKHHPDVHLGYNYCEVEFSTHAIQGLSENDFICAAKVSQLLQLD